MSARPLLERALDVPQRLLERAPLSTDTKTLLTAAVRYLKQVLRSRALRRASAKSGAS